ncbi:hypothetical protein BHE74_00047978 [Ensete ventricosum]|nr:hypothetical protein BHE74_00047978 [Ensete ventricosum]
MHYGQIAVPLHLPPSLLSEDDPTSTNRRRKRRAQRKPLSTLQHDGDPKDAGVGGALHGVEQVRLFTFHDRSGSSSADIIPFRYRHALPSLRSTTAMEPNKKATKATNMVIKPSHYDHESNVANLDLVISVKGRLRHQLMRDLVCCYIACKICFGVRATTLGGTVEAGPPSDMLGQVPPEPFDLRPGSILLVILLRPVGGVFPIADAQFPFVARFVAGRKASRGWHETKQREEGSFVILGTQERDSSEHRLPLDARTAPPYLKVTTAADCVDGIKDEEEDSRFSSRARELGHRQGAVGRGGYRSKLDGGERDKTVTGTLPQESLPPSKDNSGRFTRSSTHPLSPPGPASGSSTCKAGSGFDGEGW